jgi:hypothetical protein
MWVIPVILVSFSFPREQYVKIHSIDVHPVEPWLSKTAITWLQIAPSTT